MNNKKMKFFSIIAAIILMMCAIPFNSVSYADDEILVSDEQFTNLSGGIAYIINAFANFLNNIIQAGIKMTNGNNAKLVTIDDVVFDNFSDTSLAFFKKSSYQTTNTLLEKIKSSVSDWYGVFVGIAIAGYIVLLLVVAIKMMLVVAAKDQEKQKEYLMGWVQGLFILFFFPYVIKYSIEINHSIVQLIASSRGEFLSSDKINVEMTNKLNVVVPTEKDEGDTGIAIGKAMDQNAFEGYEDVNFMAYLAKLADKRDSHNNRSIVNAAVYLIVIIQFIILLITYYRRLFMVGFLIVIFPFVALMYPLDKVNDGKAQTFQVWSRELMLNIFVQSIHAIIYVFVVGVIYGGNQANDWLLTLVGVTFMFKGEEILKQLLGTGNGNTTKNLRETATRTVASVGAIKYVTSHVADNASHMVNATRAFRNYRAERKIANDMMGTGGGGSSGSVYAPTVPSPSAGLPIGAGIEGFNPALSGNRDYMDMVRATQVLNNIGDDNNPEEVGEALENVRRLEDSTDPNVAAVRAQLRFSKSQRSALYQEQDDLTRAALKADTSDEKYGSETVRKITKDLEIHISQEILPDESALTQRLLSRAIRHNVQKAAVAPSLTATGAAKKVYSQSEIKAEAEEAIKRGEKFIDIDGTQVELLENGGEGRVLTVSDKPKPLSSKAKSASERLLSEFEHNNKYKGKFDGLSQKKKKNLAESIAIIQDVKANMGSDRATTGDPLADKPKYSISQYADAVAFLTEEAKDSENIENLIKSKLGVTSEELQVISDEMIVRELSLSEQEDTLKAMRARFEAEEQALRDRIDMTTAEVRSHVFVPGMTESFHMPDDPDETVDEFAEELYKKRSRQRAILKKKVMYEDGIVLDPNDYADAAEMERAHIEIVIRLGRGEIIDPSYFLPPTARLGDYHLQSATEDDDGFALRVFDERNQAVIELGKRARYNDIIIDPSVYSDGEINVPQYSRTMEDPALAAEIARRAIMPSSPSTSIGDFAQDVYNQRREANNTLLKEVLFDDDIVLNPNDFADAASMQTRHAELATARAMGRRIDSRFLRSSGVSEDSYHSTVTGESETDFISRIYEARRNANEELRKRAFFNDILLNPNEFPDASRFADGYREIEQRDILAAGEADARISSVAREFTDFYHRVETNNRLQSELATAIMTHRGELDAQISRAVDEKKDLMSNIGDLESPDDEKIIALHAESGESSAGHREQAISKAREVFMESLERMQDRDKEKKKREITIPGVPTAGSGVEVKLSDSSFSKVSYDDAKSIRDDLESRGFAMDDAAAEVYYAEIANARREKVATVMRDSLEFTKEQDDKMFEAKFDGLTAEEHDRAAKSYLKKAIEETVRATATTTGVITGGFIGGAMGIGVGSDESMVKEFLAGSGAGMAIGDYLGEKGIGDDKKGKSDSDLSFRPKYDTVLVLNPYDGSVTEIDLHKNGLIRDNPALQYIGKDEVLNVHDPRLNTMLNGGNIKYNIDLQLLDAARKNRKEQDMKDLERRARVYKDALDTSRRSGSTGGS